jgi:hypothetical protein
MPDPTDVIGQLRYEPFAGEDLRREKQELLDYIAHRRAQHGLGDDDFLTVSAFGHFALLNEIGWKRIRYESFRLVSGHMYWMTDEHAMAIGRALRPTLTGLRIDLTTLAGDGFTLMADSMRAYLVLQYLCVAHRSGDEVTAVEARGLARLASKTHAASLSLWASGFEPGALDVLSDQLEQLENVWLREIDVCDLRQQAPEDEIPHPGLEALVERNRAE